MTRCGMLAVVAPAVAATRANADVVSVNECGLAIAQRVSVASAPAATSTRLIRRPELWSSSKHS